MNIKIKDIAGTELKGINLEYWGGLQGFLDATSNGASGGQSSAQQLRQVVPWLAKATDMTANAVASLPFDITNESGEIVDSSDDWKNKVGGMEIPSAIFAKLASSLCLGKAYLIPKYTSKYIVDLQYVAPHTIAPEITADGLKWLDRSTDKGKYERYYPMDSKMKPEMMYFWLPDSDVEVGPALSYPAGAALLSSRLLFSMDGTIQTYSERGFVPATILSAKGMPGAGEREKAENWWNRFLRGWTKEAAKIMNAEAMDIKQVGAGLEQLKGAYAELTKQAIENVGTAYGIPAALFMSDMAYASEANAMIKVWYETSAFVKIYTTIENTFNQQLFNRYGLKMSFHPETLDVFAEDEVASANAYKIYTDAGILPSIASKLVGLELPEGVTPEMLDAQVERKQKMEEEQARVNAEAQMAKLQANNQKPVEENPKEPEKKPAEPKEEKSISLSAAQIKELNLWRQIAERNDRKGKGKAIDFECKSLPEDLQIEIRQKLSSDMPVSSAFELSGKSRIPEIPVYDDTGLKALAEAINKAMELML
ncbi:MAG: phage portal protein [Candidatus Paceibacterota bacterium]|jgi:hypothetical protein